MTQGGGQLQLVAQGKQDVFLTGNPTTTYFKFVYRRHTNFAIESQRMYFDGSPNFGQKLTCLVPRNGDLLGPMFLKITLPQLYFAGSGKPVGYVNSPGHALIQEISIQIGEQEIDKQTGQFLEIWSALTTDASQKAGFEQMIGQRPGYPLIDISHNAWDVSGANPTLHPAVFSRENGNSMVDISGTYIRPDLYRVKPYYTPDGILPTYSNGFSGSAPYDSANYQQPFPREYDDPIMGPLVLYVPLRFWFNKNPGLYLPLLAMQYHPVRINVTLAPLQGMFYCSALYNPEGGGSGPAVCNAGLSVQPAQLGIELWGDYVYLDVPERRRFVSSPLEYLIEQTQYTPPLAIPANSRQATLDLNFNHPIKEFIWVLQRNIMQNRHEYFNWSSLGFYEIFKSAQYGFPMPPRRTDLMIDAKIQLDGEDRFDARDPRYFRLVQPYQRHTTIPSDRYIYVYSFALRPEEQQPSGTLNASRIDKIVLQLGLQDPGSAFNTSATFGDMTAYVYAVNYNVLRVIDGYAGLLFSV
jgi:hypothetical protein